METEDHCAAIVLQRNALDFADVVHPWVTQTSPCRKIEEVLRLQ
jgi:hypothetical protein